MNCAFWLPCVWWAPTWATTLDTLRVLPRDGKKDFNWRKESPIRPVVFSAGAPATVHVAVGADIIHMHPAASGAALGEGSLRDFRYFVANVARLERGVYINCGSAVVLPEVFLKAVALARNRGIALGGLTTVNLDFIRSYRAQTNVVRRPTAGTGRGYSLVGHHEIMIPLLAAAIVDHDSRT